jgi:hypothetical protein
MGGESLEHKGSIGTGASHFYSSLFFISPHIVVCMALVVLSPFPFLHVRVKCFSGEDWCFSGRWV